MKTSLSSCFSSCFASVSSLVLASSFTLFAPEAAMAATLIDSDNDGMIEGVDGLAVDGLLYDVDFVFGTSSEVYSDDFDFLHTDSTTATSLSSSLISVLSSSPSVIGVEDLDLNRADSVLLVGYDGGGSWVTDWISQSQGDFGLPSSTLGIWARVEGFSSSTEQGTASTPEPSLILGFMTLGGLMLGSKRKTKG